MQWNTWKYRQYQTVDNDDDNNNMLTTNNDEDKSGAVYGGVALLLLNIPDQELQEISSDNIFYTINQAI